ncbi:hypothetical protein DM992_26375 [Burkholderia sp. JP2-270]|uniref:cyclophilin-like fold protein n=1 Tax=Burkholderia sp. JP2-270 TaxID=2217913 RepID=UPI000DA306CB|nr:cyclophilin-like fold protein [Burkholderia sp. JP2-270]AWV02884.1 hypothetical protein DM992_26375 [Burkholderia sp. JP2-270]
MVAFYQTFDSSYSYTRLGRVGDPAGLAQALGQQHVRVAIGSGDFQRVTLHSCIGVAIGSGTSASPKATGSVARIPHRLCVP